jgi:hypothetical protein
MRTNPNLNLAELAVVASDKIKREFVSGFWIVGETVSVMQSNQ